MKKSERIYIFICLIILFIGLVGLFSGCKSKDTTLKSKTNQSTEIQNNISQSNTSTSETLKTESSKESSKDKINTDTNENTSIIQNIVEYDTDKPIDPNTGKHPVKKEITNHINSEKGTKQASQSENQFNKDKSEQINKKDESNILDKSGLKQNTQSNIDLKEDVGLNWYEEMSVWIVSIGFGCLFLWLMYKYRDKIKIFIRKLLFKI
ncbi:MAG: hypothetical protein QM653_03645 [Dysgonomonas sp.]|uniref:hypothetical protein n=1 Tax=Dysgonomonas sp. TaxID=1891233 RepID=UPI0039E3297D